MARLAGHLELEGMARTDLANEAGGVRSGICLVDCMVSIFVLLIAGPLTHGVTGSATLEVPARVERHEAFIVWTGDDEREVDLASAELFGNPAVPLIIPVPSRRTAAAVKSCKVILTFRQLGNCECPELALNSRLSGIRNGLRSFRIILVSHLASRG